MEPINASVDIGLGFQADTKIRLALEPAPESGSEWPIETDYIWLEVKLRLPAQFEELHPNLVDRDIICVGEVLSPTWGTKGVTPHRWRHTYVSAPTLSAARALADAWIAEAVAALRSVTSARAARLALRERRIKEGLES